MEKLIRLIKEKKLTLSCAESLTAGLFGSTLASFPGVSSVFKGGAITYATEIKNNVINVPHEITNEYGVISAECAYYMAQGTCKLFTSDIAISFTGNAGPDVMEGKEVGLVFIGICSKVATQTFECHFNGTRNEIREQSVKEGAKKLSQFIKENF